MLLRDSEDFKKWKILMENHNTPDVGLPPFHGTQERPVVECSFERDHVIFITLPNKETGLFYSANVVVKIKEIFQRRINNLEYALDRWRTRYEDAETGYNLQKTLTEKTQKELDDTNERVLILSEALTRSKLQTRGKNIQITKLTNKLNADKSRIRNSRVSR